MTGSQPEPAAALREKLRAIPAEQRQASQTSSVRVRRGLSWLERGEIADDLEGQFISLWIAFNAIYGHLQGDGLSVPDHATWQKFLADIVAADGTGDAAIAATFGGRIMLRILMAVVLMLAAEAQADFILRGDEHLDVTRNHSIGVLLDSSTAEVRGGARITHDAYVHGHASLSVGKSGTVERASAYDNGAIGVYSGSVDWMKTYQDSTATISRGTIAGLYTYERSAAKLEKDSKVNSLYTYGHSTANVCDETWIKRLQVHDDSAVDVCGGIIDEMQALGTSTVSISGGTVALVTAYEFSTIELDGYDFRVILGEMSINSEGRVWGSGLLAGKWLDGTGIPWTTIVADNYCYTATIRLVPDPATLSLVALGGMTMALRRRRKG